MIRNKAVRLAPVQRAQHATASSPAIVDGLFTDPCWPDSAGDTRCVLCGKAVANRYVARANHARLHDHEVWTHRDILGRTLWFPRDRL